MDKTLKSLKKEFNGKTVLISSDQIVNKNIKQNPNILCSHLYKLAEVAKFLGAKEVVMDHYRNYDSSSQGNTEKHSAAPFSLSIKGWSSQRDSVLIKYVAI